MSIRLWFIKTNSYKHNTTSCCQVPIFFSFLLFLKKAEEPGGWDVRNISHGPHAETASLSQMKISQQQFIALKRQISWHKWEWKQLRVYEDGAEKSLENTIRINLCLFCFICSHQVWSYWSTEAHLKTSFGCYFFCIFFRALIILSQKKHTNCVKKESDFP